MIYFNKNHVQITYVLNYFDVSPVVTEKLFQNPLSNAVVLAYVK